MKNEIHIEKKLFSSLFGNFLSRNDPILGYKNYGDEYKIMGLAAYGKPIYFDKILINLFKTDKK